MSKENRTSRTIDPIGGWPRTIRTTDADGTPCLVMEAYLLSPERLKFGVFLLALLLLAGYVVLFARGGSSASFETGFVLWTGVIMFLLFSQRWWLGRRLKVTMSPERMRIGRKSYDRNMIAQWAYTMHERAQDEETADIEAQVDAQMEGRKPKRKDKIYRKSWHVLMHYGGQRVDVATLYGRERMAAALRDRLGQMSGVMDQVQAFAGSSREPGDKSAPYGTRPGID